MWLEPEKFFVTRREFVHKMSEYPLNHFMRPETFRKMISIRMPSQSSRVQKKFLQTIEESKDFQTLKAKTKPNLGQYGFKGQLYEESDKMNMSLDQPVDKSTMRMLASTKSGDEHYLCKSTFFCH